MVVFDVAMTAANYRQPYSLPDDDCCGCCISVITKDTILPVAVDVTTMMLSLLAVTVFIAFSVIDVLLFCLLLLFIFWR